MWYKILFYLVVVCIELYSKTLDFSSSEIYTQEELQKDYQPTIDYLQKYTSHSYNIVVSHNKDDFYKKISSNSVDVAIVDIFTFMHLKKLSNSYLPIIVFNSSNGSKKNSCAIITSHSDGLKSIDMNNTKIAISTQTNICNKQVSKYMIDKFNVSLDAENIIYADNDINLVMGVLLQEYNIAIADTEIAKKYVRMGLNILHTSPEIVEYLFVVNTKSLAPNEIKEIRNSFLKLNITKDNSILRKWKSNIRYGCTMIDDSDFDIVEKIYNFRVK